jgi:hypothetical protein
MRGSELCMELEDFPFMKAYKNKNIKINKNGEQK